MQTMVPLYGFGGGGGAGASLTVTAPAGCTVTVSKDGKAKTKVAGADGVAVFRGLATGQWTVTITGGEQTAQKTVTVTADYSTAITFFAATINVTYPEGSTCTATDGVTTLTAPDTSGTWDCVVPNAGTWTVTVVDKQWDENVVLTNDGQSVGVNMSERWLYNSGVDNEAVTGGWYATNEGSNLVFNTVALSANGKTFITNKKAINIRNFKTVELYVSGKDAPLSDWTLGVFSSPGQNISMTPVAQYIDPYMTGLCSIDVSGLSGDYYIGAGIIRVNASTGTHWIKISSIRLVR